MVQMWRLPVGWTKKKEKKYCEDVTSGNCDGCFCWPKENFTKCTKTGENVIKCWEMCPQKSWDLKTEDKLKQTRPYLCWPELVLLDPEDADCCAGWAPVWVAGPLRGGADVVGAELRRGLWERGHGLLDATWNLEAAFRRLRTLSRVFT